jgi:flagellar biosynthesis chaperone FliJ
LEDERLRQTLAEVEQQIAAQTVAFVARSRARKVLEKLREKKLDSYEVYERRRAQAHLEELALLIRGSRRSAVEASEKE